MALSGSSDPRQALIESLQSEVAKLQSGRQPGDEQPVSTGVAALDRLLPGGGLKRGTLVEYLSAAGDGVSGGRVWGGGGIATLSLAAAREACRAGRALVVVERSKDEGRRTKDETGTSRRYFYPLAAAAWGIDLSAMLVVRTTNEPDALWAFDQALRCSGVGAVWGVRDRLDVRDFRRLQLAAEVGGTIGVLNRPALARGQPTWADVRWEVCPLAPRMRERTSFLRRWRGGQGPDGCGWRLAVELVRCRGAAGGQKVVLELDEMSGAWGEADHEPAHAMSVFAQLADSTARGA